MDLGLVRKIDIDHEMQQAYLDYAMSVIVARALPDARDGLKPVQRRILYAMYDMGLRPDSAYKKSARIVGEVLGKYHPHGDSAVYEAMARMAQDFSLRTMLVDGQGNFGSIDGDPPAAMRYTEARLAAPALDLLVDINKNTVDFTSNFDDTLTEPSVLPAALPNLLVNGATGIAVGMATSIPPHNLGEVVDALIYMLEYWEHLDDISVGHLMQFIQGPDFPTGGIILQEQGEEGIESAYGSGRGKLTIQARVHLEEMERGKSRIIVTELPYMVNKSSLIERIAELAREGHIEGLADLRDESDRQGMRIVIELSKNADPESILRDLYKRTPMQTTFSIILLALVDGEPRMLTLKQALKVYIEHRLTVIKRRAEHDLEKARARAHILEGYLIALKNLDEIIALIKASPDVDTARERLMKRYKLSELQANAILEMQLRRLAALERKKIEIEYKDLQALIKDLESLLKSPKRMREQAAEELQRVKTAYGDKRRTHIISLKEGTQKKSVLTAAEHLAEEVWVCMSADGKMCRTHDDKAPRLSGSDAPRLLARTQSNDTLYLVSERGLAAAVAVHTLPEAEKPSDGVPFNKACSLKEGDQPAAIFSLPARKSELPEESYVLSVTKGGMIKKSLIGELPGPSAQTFWLAKVGDGDALGWVGLTDGKKEVMLATALGMAIRFGEDEVRPMGLVAAGVNGIKLGVGDEVVGCEILPVEGDLIVVASDGKAKRMDVKEFPSQGRYGKGVIAWELPKGTKLAGMSIGKANYQITVHLLKAASKAVRIDEAPLRKRSAVRGEAVVEVKPGDAVTGLTSGWEVGRFFAGKKKEMKSEARAERKEAAAQLELLAPPGAKQETKSQKPTASIKSPAAKTAPGVKKLAKSETSGAKAKAPVKPSVAGKKETAAKKPAANTKELAIKTVSGEKKASKSEKPAVKAATTGKQKVVKEDKPAGTTKTAAKTPAPAAKSPKTTADAKKEVKTEKPAAAAKTPAVKSTKTPPTSKKEVPAGKTKVPAAKPAAGAKKDTKTEKPVAKQPAAKPAPPKKK